MAIAANIDAMNVVFLCTHKFCIHNSWRNFKKITIKWFFFKKYSVDNLQSSWFESVQTILHTHKTGQKTRRWEWEKTLVYICWRDENGHWSENHLFTVDITAICVFVCCYVVYVLLAFICKWVAGIRSLTLIGNVMFRYFIGIHSLQVFFCKNLK